MKILLAEYAMSHDPTLAHEGIAMFKTLKESFERCKNQVLSPVPEKDFGKEILRLGPLCDIGLIIAPDNILARYTKYCEDTCRSIGCNSMTIALCANKKTTSGILASHNIDVPCEVTTGKRIVKPLTGSGSQGVRLTEEPCNATEFEQEFILGDNISVSLIGSRVCGESCSCYTGKKPLVLSINKQNIRIDKNGQFHYEGGEIPYFHKNESDIIKTAIKTTEVLGCQGYVGIDMVVNNYRIVVVDVNPRPTDSIIGLSKVLAQEIGNLIIRASYGDLPDFVELTGHVRFDATGRILV